MTLERVTTGAVSSPQSRRLFAFKGVEGFQRAACDGRKAPRLTPAMPLPNLALIRTDEEMENAMLNYIFTGKLRKLIVVAGTFGAIALIASLATVRCFAKDNPEERSHIAERLTPRLLPVPKTSTVKSTSLRDPAQPTPTTTITITISNCIPLPFPPYLICDVTIVVTSSMVTHDTTVKSYSSYSNPAEIAGNKLILKNLSSSLPDSITLESETVVDPKTSATLGYRQVTLLPGTYQIEQRVLGFNVRTEGRVVKDADVGKIEVSGQFASLNVGHSSRTAPGVGTRLTYNVVRNIALEAEVNHFPEENQGTNRLGSGRITQGLFGLKAGRRFETFGVFGKVRPGLVSFGQTILGSRLENGRLSLISGRSTHSALDVGGVVEFYPSRRLVTRFDIGDTIIRYPCPTPTFPLPTGGDLFTNPCPLGSLTTTGTPPKQYLTEHNFQFNSSVGFRFF